MATKTKTITVAVNVGGIERSVDLDAQSVVNHPTYAIETVTQLATEAALEFTTNQKDGIVD